MLGQTRVFFYPTGCFGLIAWVFLLTGCSSHQLYWAKPGAHQGEFEQDLRECRRELGISDRNQSTHLSLSVGTDSVPIQQCLGDRGWYLAQKSKN